MQKYNQLLITVPEVDSKDKAKATIGKTVIWKTPAGREIKGKVSNVHGNKGTFRTIFETGMPGQCLGTTVEIVE